MRFEAAILKISAKIKGIKLLLIVLIEENSIFIFNTVQIRINPPQ
jgi:hypothetical protein